MSATLFALSPRRLALILGFKALLIASLILYAGVGLGPDEAQYWTWSRALDWGYYSKPPGIAWQIWLGNLLLGSTEWGVRALSLPLGALQAWALYRLALASGLLPRTAVGCGLLMAFCPLGLLGSFFAITDVGFLLCWTGACLTTVSALQKGRAPDPLRVGGWLLGGALFKWPIYLFWFFFFLSYFRRFPPPSKGRLAAGLLISLLGLLPSLWWNAAHEWATFRHVAATLQGGSGARAAGNLGEFLGSQALLLSPLLFILLLGAFWEWGRERHRLSPALLFSGRVTLIGLGLALITACFQKVQGNWMVLAYPTALVVLGWDAFERHPGRTRWVEVGLVLSVALTLLLFLLPSLYSRPSLAAYAPPYRMNPFKHNLGWDRLAPALKRLGYRPNEHFLAGDKYQTTSLLSFYGEEQRRAYLLNLEGMRKNQFSYWPSLHEEQQGKRGYFVWVENAPYLEREGTRKLASYEMELKRYFEEVEFLELVPLIQQGAEVVKAAFIFRCGQCKASPADPLRY